MLELQNGLFSKRLLSCESLRYLFVHGFRGKDPIYQLPYSKIFAPLRRGNFSQIRSLLTCIGKTVPRNTF